METKEAIEILERIESGLEDYQPTVILTNGVSVVKAYVALVHVLNELRSQSTKQRTESEVKKLTRKEACPECGAICAHEFCCHKSFDSA